MSCIIWCVSPASARQKDLHFKHITSDHGLAHNAVYAIFQDQRGYMWFGTQEGLNRYDGYEMKLYRNELGNPASIDHNWIMFVNEDSRGNMWVCTSGGGLNKYIYETDSFESVLDKSQPGLSEISVVYNFVEDRHGFIWISTNAGLFRFDRDFANFKHYTNIAEDPSSLSDEFVRYVFIDSHDVLWVGTRNGGLNRYEESTDSFLWYTANPADQYSLSSNFVMQISEDKNGVLWVSTLQGLSRFDPALDGFHTYAHNAKTPGSLSISDVRTQFTDTRGNLWVGTYNGGLNLFDRQQGTFEAYEHHPALPKSLSNNKVRSIWEDHAGILWIGTENGVNYVDLEAGFFSHYKHEPSQRSSISDNAIYAIYADPADPDIVWIGTEFGGLNRIDRSSGAVSQYVHDRNDASSLSHNFVDALLIDHAGVLWAGTRDGLNKFDEVTGTFERFFTGTTRTFANRIRVVYEAPSTPGVLWLASGGSGLTRFDVQTGKIERFTPQPGDPYGLSNGWVSALYEDGQGNFWVGTSGGGLCQFYRNKGTFNCFEFDEADPHSLASTQIEGIGETEDGLLWLATDNGLVKFDTSRLRFQHFTERNSDIASSTIRSLVVDDADNIWMGTIAGIVKYDPAQHQFEHYDIELGLQARAFNARVAHLDNAGNAYFGGLNGFNAFHPKNIKGNPYSPRIALTRVSIFDEQLEPAANAPLTQHISKAETISLSHNQNEISIEYLGMHYSSPEKNQYQVKLAAYDEDWRPPSRERKITYTSLDPGEYTFMVRTANAYGVWSDQVKQLNILIAPPWWLRYWAFGIYLVLFVAGVVLIDRFQRARLLKKEREAAQMREAEFRAKAAELKFQAAASDARALMAENEQKEVELQKAEELKEAYDALQESMNQLQIAQRQLVQAEKMASLGQLTAGIAHEIKNPLNFVVNFARISENLMDDLKTLLKDETEKLTDTTREDVEHMLETLTLNTERIREHGLRADSIVKSMMEHSRSSSGAKAPVSLQRVIEQAIDLAQMGAVNEIEDLNLVIEKAFDPDLGEISLNAQDFKRVIINILDNAFYALKEHAATCGDSFQPAIRIRCTRNKNSVEIKIQDNGPGLDEATKAKLFEPFFTTKPPGTGNTGLGLSLSYDIITQGHNGTLAVEGKPGEGAAFIIRIPT